MRLLYATRFRVSDASFGAIVEKIQQWIGSYYAHQPSGEQPKFCDVTSSEEHDTFIEESVQWASVEPHSVESKLHATEQGRLYEVTWKRPSNSPGVDQIERVQATLLQADETLEFSVQSTLQIGAFQVAPLDPGVVQRPRIVDQLVEGYSCRIGPTPVLWYSQRLQGDTVSSYLQDTLEHPERTLPVVLVSHASGKGRPIRDPDWVQNRLLGMANVAEVTPEASAQLSDVVGRVRSCTDGQVRVYWPGFTRRAVPSDHPYFTPAYMRAQRDEGTDIEDILFDRIARVATERYTQSDRLRDFRRHLRAVRKEELLQSKEELPEELLEDYEKTLDENERLRREIEGLEEQLEVAKKNLQHVRRATSEDEKAPADERKSRDEVSSPSEALRFAEERFGQNIYVWKSARQAAAKAEYHDPVEIVEVLECIAELAAAYRRKDGNVGPWREHFDTQGIKFARHESEPTMNQHGDDRRFHDGDEQMVMQPHVTIGQGREHCLQIYFQRIDGDDRFQVGYCGDHLPYASSGT